MVKKVLIIAYYWPPAGGPGVQRWVKFVKYLPDFDIEPIVYIPENAEYPIQDVSLEQDVSNNLRVLKRPIFEPLKYAKIIGKNKAKSISSGIIKQQNKQNLLERIMLYVRGNYFIPDARKYWVKPSVKFLKKYIEENAIEIIITTGPPHSLHLIGLGLKKQNTIQWIADFRDPWTSISYHEKLKLNEKSKQKHKQLEREVLNTADKILVTSPSTKAEFQTLTDKPITVITNGYDDSSKRKTSLDSAFSIAHIGSLLSDRNPIVLWKILGELVHENTNFSADFVLKLAGTISNDVLESIKNNGLENNIKLYGYIPHNETLELQKNSQILLLITIDSKKTKGIIPGKLFEYLVSGRPILGIGAEQADFKEIILKTNTGTCFNYNNDESLKKQILKYYELYKQNALKTHPIGLNQYHRKELTGKLARTIKQ